MATRVVAAHGPRGGTLKGHQGSLEERERQIAELTTQRPSRDVLKNAALRAGMGTLREDGLDKVARGFTTLAELERALP